MSKSSIVRSATDRKSAMPRPTLGGRLRFSASLVIQGPKQFFSLTMPTDVLSQCCFVTSRNEDPKAGFQRVLDRRRAQDIADYIDSGRGTIPGAIILSAQPEAELKLIGGGKTVEFTFSEKAFLVLDGQHRVYGFSLAVTALRIPVVIYSGLTPIEEARLFIDINTKQKQVPNELLLDIKQLAEREDDREILLREVFDAFASNPNSALLGLMSPAARQRSKISRVTFNLAFKSALTVFTARRSEHIFQVTNAYLSAFCDVLEKIGVPEALTVPTVFRAIMDTFPEVARIYAAQHGKNFVKAKFAAVLQPIADQITAGKIGKNSQSVKDLSEMFARTIKKDFSI